MKIFLKTTKLKSIWSKIQNNHIYLYILLANAVVARFLYSFYIPRETPEQWPLWKYDPLFITAVVVFGIVFKVSLNIPEKMNITIKRILYRGIINSEDHLQESLKKRANKLSNICGSILGTVIFIAWIRGFELKIMNILLIIFETFLAYLTGRILGTMVAYGTLGSILRKEKITLNLQPEHIDGAAGLKPVGDFYFFQFVIASMPAFFIAGWWLLLLVLTRNGISIPKDTSQWKDEAILLLPLAMIVEALVFILPMVSFNQQMRNFKANLLNDPKKSEAKPLKSADQISNAITTMKAELLNAKNEPEHNLIKYKVSYLSEKYHAYERMPTWPVSPSIRRLFTINNLILLIPILLKIIPVIINTFNKINQHSPS
ncbi:hypothetical protein WKK05_35325 [Nostoc sp. UHCC 0302]|uniref:hypothetical protein n=1 Tax=Nostoc sp. UHCC 0302 TaxID=3134896 RepID=UPI00311CABAA